MEWKPRYVELYIICSDQRGPEWEKYCGFCMKMLWKKLCENYMNCDIFHTKSAKSTISERKGRGA